MYYKKNHIYYQYYFKLDLVNKLEFTEIWSNKQYHLPDPLSSCSGVLLTEKQTHLLCNSNLYCCLSTPTFSIISNNISPYNLK